MKKGFLFFALALMIVSCTEPVEEETPIVVENLVSNWNGSGLTGTGSEPTNFGWLSSNAAAVWGIANSSVVGSTRYMDITTTSTPLHYNNDTVFTGRILMYRWDGSYWGSLLTKKLSLAANTTYTLKWKYEWWANGTLPTYNLAIGTAVDGSSNIVNKDFVASSTKNILMDGNMSFTSTVAGEYYLIIKQNGLTSAEGTLIGISALSLTKE